MATITLLRGRGLLQGSRPNSVKQSNDVGPAQADRFRARLDVQVRVQAKLTLLLAKPCIRGSRRARLRRRIAELDVEIGALRARLAR